MSRLIVLRGITGAGKSTVGRSLEGLGFVLLELDDVKMDKYGTTTKCIPAEDFPSFGRRVRSKLEAGRDVVAVEAFVDRQHIDWFLREAGEQLQDPDVAIVWLECSVQCAVQRKKGVLSERTVRGQHGRMLGRYQIPAELCLNTDTMPVREVVAAILAHLEKKQRSPYEDPRDPP